MMTVILSLISVGILLSVIRLVKGPSVMDRVVSVDTINMMIVGFIAVLAIVLKNNLYLDIAIVYGILAFLETIVLAKYMEGKSWMK